MLRAVTHFAFLSLSLSLPLFLSFVLFPPFTLPLSFFLYSSLESARCRRHHGSPRSGSLSNSQSTSLRLPSTSEPTCTVVLAADPFLSILLFLTFRLVQPDVYFDEHERIRAGRSRTSRSSFTDLSLSCENKQNGGDSAARLRSQISIYYTRLLTPYIFLM